jgi:hypothetical protein
MYISASSSSSSSSSFFLEKSLYYNFTVAPATSPLDVSPPLSVPWGTQTRINPHPTETVRDCAREGTNTPDVRCARARCWQRCKTRIPRTPAWRANSPLSTCSSRLRKRRKTHTKTRSFFSSVITVASSVAHPSHRAFILSVLVPFARATEIPTSRARTNAPISSSIDAPPDMDRRCVNRPAA